MLTRRELLLGATMALTGIGRIVQRPTPRRSGHRVPLIHTTDLYHPPQDPDDHIDLATLAALPELDLRGVILDATQRFLDPAPTGFDIARDPGFIPVAQLAHILGRSIPVAAGPLMPLEHPADDLARRTAEERKGVDFLLQLLEETNDPVAISVVGSARTITAAFNRNPRLLREKTRVVILNAGATGGPKREWNVGLDPAAYVGLWRSGLPIDWFPCATEGGAFNPEHERGTYWKTTHEEIFRKLQPRVRSWFAYALTGSKRKDTILALSEEVAGAAWEGLLPGSRNLWATASLVMAAGRELRSTPDGWRFVQAGSFQEEEIWPWHLEPIDAEVSDDGSVTWRLTTRKSRARIFGRKPGRGFGERMTGALRSLLGDLGP